ncbi:hypothetical protein, partial [Agromyces seonyuensis]
MPRLPDVLTTADLPLAELCAARIDGDLVRLAAGWTAVDEPDLRETRAAAIAVDVPGGLIAVRFTAAWVHGAVDAPPVVGQFASDIAKRRSSILAPTIEHSELVLASGDLARYAGVPCTTPERTAYDLARDRQADDERVVPALTRLLAGRTDVAARVAERLDVPHLPHAALARGRLAAALRHLAAGRA